MKKIEELDLARVVAMLSVIMIHVTSTYIYYDSKYMILNMNIAYILNQISRFSVPLFILLSGTTLGLSAAFNGTSKFYKKRLIKIGLPYFFWFTIYYLYNHHSNLQEVFSNGFMSIPSYIRSLFLGQSAPHLYFIIIIFQFYLLYPLLIKVVERAPWKSLIISFIISYTIQKAFFFLNFDLDLIPDWLRPYLWLLFPTWIFYFVLGMTLTRKRLNNIRIFATQNALPIILGTLLFGILYVIESQLTRSLDAIKSSLNLFTVLVLLSSFSIWKLIGKNTVIQTVTRFLAQHSMTIYFGHVLILYFFRQFPVFSNGMSGMFLLYITVFIVAVIFAVLIDKIPQLLKSHRFTTKEQLPTLSDQVKL